uniref:Uncharacterized protein n=1 Tax=Rhizophora mucronata TaxID=61149 RepID=A0A2P2PAH5_RHIMU
MGFSWICPWTFSPYFVYIAFTSQSWCT